MALLLIHMKKVEMPAAVWQAASSIKQMAVCCKCIEIRQYVGLAGGLALAHTVGPDSLRMA